MWLASAQSKSFNFASSINAFQVYALSHRSRIRTHSGCHKKKTNIKSTQSKYCDENKQWRKTVGLLISIRRQICLAVCEWNEEVIFCERLKVSRMKWEKNRIQNSVMCAIQLSFIRSVCIRAVLHLLLLNIQKLNAYLMFLSSSCEQCSSLMIQLLLLLLFVLLLLLLPL